MIDGTLRATIPGANLYLLNPAGVLFGANASLDLSGSFHVGTADYLKFTAGEKFFVDPANTNTVLSVAPVAAFGFLSPNPAAIVIDRRNPVNPITQPALQVSLGKTFSVVGGDITIIGPTPILVINNEPVVFETLLAPRGRINLAGVASMGEVVLTKPDGSPDLDVTSFARLGSIDLQRHARIETSEVGGNGTVVIRGGRLQVANQSFIFSDVPVNTGGGSIGSVSGAPIGIDIEVTQDLVVSNGGRVTSEIEFGVSGSAGDVLIHAGSVEVTGTRSLIGSRLFPGSTGTARNVDITTGSLTISNAGRISTASGGSEAGGGIRVGADTINILNGGAIESNTVGAGQGGKIALQARAIYLRDGAAVSAKSTGTGNAGNISITASDDFVARNSFVTTEDTQADGGDIRFEVGRLFHLINSEITTKVGGGTGSGGNIFIDPQLVFLDGSRIIASAIGGSGGNITIVAGLFLASPDSVINASSSLGISGSISIQAPTTNLSGTLAPLPEDFLQAAGLLRARCAAQLSGKASSFVLAGRDGLPPEPGALQPSPLSYRIAGTAALNLSQTTSLRRRQPSAVALKALTMRCSG